MGSIDRDKYSCCIKDTCDSIILFKEKKAVLRIKNDRNACYRRIQIDGCVIKEGKRCDWLLESCEHGDQFFIELKGSCLDDAIKQLWETVRAFGNARGEVYAFVVSSNCGARINTARQALEKKFKNRGVELRFFHSNSNYSLLR